MTEFNHNGCMITRSFHAHRERYHYDFHLKRLDGWMPYRTAQDSHCFGVWVNRVTRQVITFAEGDEVLTTAPNQESFDAELADMQVVYAIRG